MACISLPPALRQAMERRDNDDVHSVTVVDKLDDSSSSIDEEINYTDDNIENNIINENRIKNRVLDDSLYVQNIKNRILSIHNKALTSSNISFFLPPTLNINYSYNEMKTKSEIKNESIVVTTSPPTTSFVIIGIIIILGISTIIVNISPNKTSLIFYFFILFIMMLFIMVITYHEIIKSQKQIQNNKNIQIQKVKERQEKYETIINDWLFELNEILLTINELKTNSNDLFHCLEEMSLISFGYSNNNTSSSQQQSIIQKYQISNNFNQSYKIKIPPIVRIEANYYSRKNDNMKNIPCRSLRIAFGKTLIHLKQIYENSSNDVRNMTDNSYLNRDNKNFNSNKGRSNISSNEDISIEETSPTRETSPNTETSPILLFELKEMMNQLELISVSTFNEFSEIGFQIISVSTPEVLFNNNNNNNTSEVFEEEDMKVDVLILDMLNKIKIMNELINNNWNSFNLYMQTHTHLKKKGKYHTSTNTDNNDNNDHEDTKDDKNDNDKNKDKDNDHDKVSKKITEVEVRLMKQTSMVKLEDKMSCLRHHFDTLSMQLYLAHQYLIDNINDESINDESINDEVEHNIDDSFQKVGKFLESSQLLSSNHSNLSCYDETCSVGDGTLDGMLDGMLELLHKTTTSSIPSDSFHSCSNIWDQCHTYLKFLKLNNNECLTYLEQLNLTTQNMLQHENMTPGGETNIITDDEIDCNQCSEWSTNDESGSLDRNNETSSLNNQISDKLEILTAIGGMSEIEQNRQSNHQTSKRQRASMKPSSTSRSSVSSGNKINKVFFLSELNQVLKQRITPIENTIERHLFNHQSSLSPSSGEQSEEENKMMNREDTSSVTSSEDMMVSNFRRKPNLANFLKSSTQGLSLPSSH